MPGTQHDDFSFYSKPVFFGLFVHVFLYTCTLQLGGRGVGGGGGDREPKRMGVLKVLEARAYV